MTLRKEILRAIRAAKEVVLANASKATERTGDINPYGDLTLVLDKKAEDVIIDTLLSAETPLAIFSEERGFLEPEGQPEYLAVIDPIDGSANLERGIPLCSVGISLVPFSNNMMTDDAELSVIESFYTKETYIAEKG
ncbi:MAG: inositol monophosphatase family protein, partial [Candidatus Hodarchaeota archaeon]